MFMLLDRKRRQRRSHTLKSTVLLAAVLVFANAAVLLGLGAARASTGPEAMQVAAIPYADLTHAVETDAVYRDARAYPVSATVPPPSIVRRLPVMPAQSHRSLVRVSLVNPEDRGILLAILGAALAAMGGVSVYLLRTLAREVKQTERRDHSRR